MIHREIRGHGPVLLISQSGEGDAGRTKDLVDQLESRYTCVTYDRRGLSRSAADGYVSMAEHADDAHRLLAEVTDEPASMLGCSFGAVLGLHLAARYPGQVGTLIAHEPVAPWLLPEADRLAQCAELVRVQVTLRERGWQEAVKEMVKILGINPHDQETEQDITPNPITEQRAANFGFFIRNDFTAVIEDSLDLAALKNTTTRIVPAAGHTTPRHVFDYRCAVELSLLTGNVLEEFPGGHNGNLTHPRAYAARVLEVLGA